MSIEAKIDALIAALTANTAALSGAKAAPTAKTPAQQIAEHTATKAIEKAAATPTPAADKPLNYDTDVKPVALKLIGANRPKFVELLAKYKVDNAVKLKPEQYKGFVADVKAALA